MHSRAQTNRSSTSYFALSIEVTVLSPCVRSVCVARATTMYAKQKSEFYARCDEARSLNWSISTQSTTLVRRTWIAYTNICTLHTHIRAIKCSSIWSQSVGWIVFDTVKEMPKYKQMEWITCSACDALFMLCNVLNEINAALYHLIIHLCLHSFTLSTNIREYGWRWRGRQIFWVHTPAEGHEDDKDEISLPLLIILLFYHQLLCRMNR